MYTTLRDQSFPQTIADTSKMVFIQPDVDPYYTVVRPEPELIKPEEPTYSNNPVEWGPYLWYYLHTIAANYPKNPSAKQREGMKKWLCSLKWTIPCKNCSVHYGGYINKHRPHLDYICNSRENLFEFLHDIHNKVNKRTNKPEMSLDEAKKQYSYK